MEGCFCGGCGREQSRHFPKSAQFYETNRLLVRVFDKEFRERDDGVESGEEKELSVDCRNDDTGGVIIRIRIIVELPEESR